LGGSRRSALAMGFGMKCDNRIEDTRSVIWSHRRAADDPGQKLVVGNLHQRLEIGEIVIGEARYMGIREWPEKQVHFAHAPVPGTKKRTPPARVKVVAGAGDTGHKAVWMAKFAKNCYLNCPEEIMATMNVSLPDPMREWIEERVRRGEYANASDYVRDLVRHDREQHERLVEALIEGEKSGVSTRTVAEIAGAARSKIRNAKG